MNNRAWFYSIDTRQLVNQKEYHGTVSQAVLGADYAAVRVEGQVVLHPYDPSKAVVEGRDDKRFPEKRWVFCLSFFSFLFVLSNPRSFFEPVHARILYACSFYARFGIDVRWFGWLICWLILVDSLVDWLVGPLIGWRRTRGGGGGRCGN